MCTYRLCVVVFGSVFLSHNISSAQVATDGTTGAAKTISGPDYDIGADLGTQAGSNLFHSFDKFSVNTGESATFSGPGSVDNIIGRVTGGSLSQVDGLLASTIPGASLWLFNPSGVVFGPNASLDVSGSFHVSTADELRTADGGKFSAVDPQSSGFSVAAPESFGFLGADPAGITVARSKLSVSEGETLSIVGGDVDIRGADLDVGAGGLNVLAAGGPADANVATGELTGSADGAVTIREAASLAATGDGGGAIRIEGGAFVIDGDSEIVSTNTGSTDGDVGIDIDVKTADITGDALITTDTQADGKGGDINLNADDVQVNEKSIIATNSVTAGQGGDINIDGGRVAFRSDGFAITVTQGSGEGGAIGITADDLSLTNGDIITTTDVTASGDSGDIVIAAGSIELRAGGPGERSSIGTGSLGSGAAGDVDIRSSRVLVDGGGQLAGAAIRSLSDSADSRGGQIRLVVGSLVLLRGGVVFGESSGGSAEASSIEVTADTIRIDGSVDTVTGITLNVDGQGTTTPGAIIVRAGDIDIENGGKIESTSANANDASNIVIAADSISLDSQGSGPTSTISSSSSLGATGNAGQITIVADTIELSGNATIRSAAFGEGDAGVIDINASTSLKLRDQSDINTSTASSSTGAAGSIVIKTTDLVILDGSTILSSTFGSGDAGSIAVTADTALLDARNVSQLGGISTQSNPGSSGSAGDIDLSINDLTIRGTSQVSSASFSTGSAGTVSIRSDDITIDGREADPNFLTGISTSVISDSAGEGGAIVIVADRLVMRGETAEVTSFNDGAGPAGTIDIQLTESLVLDGGADINTTSASAGGGGITIKAGDFVIATGSGSEIATSVADDAGDAGDIVIDTPLLALGDAKILAKADAGRGGDIRIAADDLILSPDAEISAQAGATGVDGTIAVTAPEVDLTSGLAGFDSRFLNVSSLLRERCAARRAESGSSFTLGTGGSIPADLDAPRLSLVRAGPDKALSGGQKQRTVLVLPCPKAAS